MTGWLADNAMPPGLQLADECELVDPAGADRWRGRKIVNMGSSEVFGHLRAGKQVSRLGVELDDRMGFVLGEDMTIRKLRFFDVVMESLDDGGYESVDIENAASFLVMVNEVRRLLTQLITWFDIRPMEDA